jgi:hypothetical protein
MAVPSLPSILHYWRHSLMLPGYTPLIRKKCSDGGNTSCCMLLVGIVMA